LPKIRAGGLLKPHEQIVLLITGHGLKDVDAAMKNIRLPAAIEPTPAGVERIAGRLAVRGGRAHGP
jgi:threonine synthase